MRETAVTALRHTPPLMVFCRVFGYIAHFIGAVEKGTIIPHRGFRTPDGRGGRFDTPKFWRRTGGLPKEMLFEVICLRPSSENPTVGVRDIHEDDDQEFNAVSLRPLTAEDLLGIFSTV